VRRHEIGGLHRTQRDGAYDRVRTEAAAGRQAYVVCALVDESDESEAKAATAEAERLRTKVFPDLEVGLLTPFAYGGVAALMLVAFMTNHRQNGFFLTSAKEGYEYVVTVAVVSIAIATFGAGKWSLDHAIDSSSFLFDPKKALAVAAIVGIGGAAAFLAVFWRPPKKAADAG
jgi:hypothetical protein